MTKFSLSLIAVLLLSVPCISQIAEEEPNDEQEQAQVIDSPNETVIASMEQPYAWDYFQVSTTEWGSLNVQIVNNESDPCSFILLPFTDGVGALENWTSGELSMTECCLAPGTYVIGVRACANTAPNTEYYLELTFTEGEGVSDEGTTQENNTLSTATDIGSFSSTGSTNVPGTLGYDDHTQGGGFSKDRDDWFKWDFTKRTALYYDSIPWSYEACSAQPAGDVTWDFRPSATGQFSNSDLVCLQSGTYYLEIEPPGWEWAAELCVEYDAHFSWDSFEEKDDGTDDFADGSIENAHELNVSQEQSLVQVEGYLGFTKWTPNYDYDEYDYWHMTTSGNGTVNIHLLLDEELTGSLEVVNADGGLIYGAQVTNTPGVKTWERACLGPDVELVIKVRRTGGCGSYVLTANEISIEGEEDEPNDQLEDAVDMELDLEYYSQLGYETTDIDLNFETDVEDWFKLNGSAVGTFEILASNNSEGIFPIIEVHMDNIGGDVEQEELLHIGPTTTYEADNIKHHVYECPPEQADIYVRVIKPLTWTCGTYTLQLSVIEDLTPYLDSESPDTLMVVGLIQEGVIGLGQEVMENQTTTWVTSDTEDTYLFSVPASSTLRVTLEKNIGVEPVICSFSPYSKDGTDIFFNGNLEQDDEDVRVWSMACVSRDTLMVKVTGGQGCGRYRLTVEAEDAVISDFSYEDGDEEPNNSFDEAQDLETPDPLDLPIVNGLLGYRNLNTPTQFDFEDYYTFSLTGAGSATFQFSDAEILPTLTLYQKLEGDDFTEYHELSVCEDPDETPNSFNYCCLGEGEYYLKISSINVNGYDCREYVFDFGVGSIENDDEDIDEQPMTGTVVMGTLGHITFDGFSELEEPEYATDEEDSYVLSDAEYGDLKVTVRWTNISGEMTIQPELLFNGDYFAPENVENYTDSVVVTHQCIAEGDYTITLMRQAITLGACANYELEVKINNEGYDSDSQFNDAIGSAQPIPTNSWVEGTLGYKAPINGADEDNSDYFKFNLESYGKAEIQVEFPDYITLNSPSDAPIAYGLWHMVDEEQAGIDITTDVYSGYLVFYANCLPAGEYFISLSNSQSCIEYKVRALIDEDNFDADTETTMETWFDATILTIDEEHEDLLGFNLTPETNFSDKYILPIESLSDVEIDLAPVAGGYLHAEISYLDGDEEFMLGSWPLIEGSDPLFLECLPPNNYRIEVTLNSVCTKYSLTASAIEIEDFMEPNDESPASISDNTQFDAVVGYDNPDTEISDVDSYSFIAMENQLVAINVTASNNVILAINHPDMTWSAIGDDLGHEFHIYNEGLVELTVSGFDCTSYTLITTSEQEIIADFDGDGQVGINDLLDFLGNFGCTSDCEGDLDGDGTVTVFDLLIFLEWFGWPN